ncbi:hypothetical protein AVEN_224120-1 [Araneus ventricosus]|uniref:Uncharacterized protein n=1 Tax=Araneus ventricosus TaxID=182803 RepID=A0A4Y2DXY4_ARAVE|nr:hypothetical protein AVEN_224120-1 [Araneus ventricosus]
MAFNCRCKNVLNNFYAIENIDEHVVDLFKIVDKKIDELYIKSKTLQPKITSFFNVVDDQISENRRNMARGRKSNTIARAPFILAKPLTTTSASGACKGRSFQEYDDDKPKIS